MYNLASWRERHGLIGGETSRDAEILKEELDTKESGNVTSKTVSLKGDPIAMQCSQCGATFASHETCSDRFNTTQIKEVENSTSYYAVHHLSVPCYTLQHNTYSRDGWLAVRQLLHQFVYAGLTPAEARWQNHRTLDSGQRTWSLTKGAKLAQVDDIVWTRTIAGVRIDTAEHYCADVRDWAIAVLADTAALVHALG